MTDSPPRTYNQTLSIIPLQIVEHLPLMSFNSAKNTHSQANCAKYPRSCQLETTPSSHSTIRGLVGMKTTNEAMTIIQYYVMVFILGVEGHIPECHWTHNVLVYLPVVHAHIVPQPHSMLC